MKNNKCVFQIITASLLFTILLLSTICLQLRGVRKPLLCQYISFNGYFSVTESLLLFFLMLTFSIYCFGLGNYVSRRFNLNLPLSFVVGLGVILFNIVLIPLFFLKLFSVPLLLSLFLLISLPVGKDILIAWNDKVRNSRIEVKYAITILIIVILPLGLHFLDALLPVDYLESSGDIANNYLRTSMYFAARHGVNQDIMVTSPFANFEMICSALIVLANPGIIKLFGFMLLSLTFFLILEFSRYILHSKWYIVALLFLICPFFVNQNIVSMVHPRVYLIFLSSFIFFVTYIGHQRAQPKYHFLSLIGIGLLIGTTYHGLVCGAVNLLLILFDFEMVKKNLRQYILFGALSLSLAIVFPLWVYSYQGSPFPKVALFNKIFAFKVNPGISNDWLIHRVALQFQHLYQPTLAFYVFSFIKLLFMYIGPLIVFLIIASCLFRDLAIGYFTFYLLFNIFSLEVLLPGSMTGGSNLRFSVVGLPVLLAFTAHTMERAKVWIESKSQLHLSTQKSPFFQYFLNIIFVGFILVSIFYVLKQSSDYLLRQDNLSRKLSFVTRKINLREYLNSRDVIISEYLNQNLNAEDKVLYFVHPSGIYTYPRLYQTSCVGLASIVYTSTDKNIIMDKLRENGIAFLCVDDEWGGVSNNPFYAMLADFTTPIFEPDFFACHFIPYETTIPGFFLFKICYDGLDDVGKIKVNFEHISRIGFFQFIYNSILNNYLNVVVIKENPYSIDTLFFKYREAMDRIYEKN